MENVWCTLKNPWTKEVVYITSNNSLVLSEAGLVESTIANDVIPTKSSFPGGFNELLGDGSCHNLTDATLGEAAADGGAGRSCSPAGAAVRAGRIGRQIADEVLEQQRRGDSSSYSSDSPFEGVLGSAYLLGTATSRRSAVAGSSRAKLHPV